jgi:hypothetical protein
MVGCQRTEGEAKNSWTTTKIDQTANLKRVHGHATAVSLPSFTDREGEIVGLQDPALEPSIIR